MADVITFRYIREIHLEEKNSQKLAKIPENFYELVKDYLEKKEQEGNLSEIKNVKIMVEEIFNRRERKIINFAIISARTGFVPENMTEEEKMFFEKLVEVIKSRRSSILEKLTQDKKSDDNLVIFKEDVPSFIGADGEEYGPFSKGDIAKLPKENAELLVKQGYAEWLEK